VKEIRVATANKNKMRELKQMLEPLGYSVRGTEDLADFDVVEDGDTFEANAIKKARALCEITGTATVADDSGLEVDALGKKPGVHSARYAGVVGSDRDRANRVKLIEAMRDVPDGERAGRFRCALVYLEPGCDPIVFHGTLEGEIGREERGDNGFGYDPIFIIPGDGRTAAELPSDEKNLISHRGQAVKQLLAFLESHTTE